MWWGGILQIENWDTLCVSQIQIQNLQQLVQERKHIKKATGWKGAQLPQSPVAGNFKEADIFGLASMRYILFGF